MPRPRDAKRRRYEELRSAPRSGLTPPIGNAGRMPALRITEDEIRAAVTAVYYDGRHAPRMLWVDHFDDDWSYVRAQYPAEFCKHCARRLLRVVRAIKDTSGNEPTVTICIYMGSSDELADERSAFVKNRLSGFSP